MLSALSEEQIEGGLFYLGWSLCRVMIVRIRDENGPLLETHLDLHTIRLP